MTDTKDTVKCANCGASIDCIGDTPDHRAPCMNCGSRKRIYSISINEKMVMRGGIGMSVKRPGGKRPYIEDRSVPDFSKSREKLVHREQVIDRDNDRYLERVKDYESGEVIHHCEEPLSEHRGHGSAKAKK